MNPVTEKEDAVSASLIIGKGSNFQAASSQPRANDPTIVRSAGLFLKTGESHE
jgi:hypothetical protein